MDFEQEDEDRRLNPEQTPLSMATPAGFDDSASQVSRVSGADRSGRAMRIIRKVKNKLGTVEEVVHIVKDPRVWRAYQQKRHAIENQSTNVYDAKPTGNADWDRLEALRYGIPSQANFSLLTSHRVKTELARLERNKERRHAREKQKGIIHTDADGASPSSTPAKSVEKPTGTTRKCANCGQAGHIKTNKKYCPFQHIEGSMIPAYSSENYLVT